MKTIDFDFDLPSELIAQRPSGVRGNDRLMLLEKSTGKVSHFSMSDLQDLILPGTVMVFNNSRVRKSRCYGVKSDTGREQEFLFLSQSDDKGFVWKTLVRGAKKVHDGGRYTFPDGSEGSVILTHEDEGSEFRLLSFSFALKEEWFEKNGHIPLPPYIKREDDDTDSERYQTIYAKETGSAACPTAGLHFTEPLLQKLREKGVFLEWITLHVGLGTFLPVRTENIEEHKMHEEFYTVPYSVAEKINIAKKEGRPILAVGTTTVRTLESASNEKGEVQGGSKSTSIFMYPGYKFKVVDQMFTNFHTPESTLIMLVSAFAGRENILDAYQKAVQEKYRFFSYGDAMLIR